jgi:hypothetical protein
MSLSWRSMLRQMFLMLAWAIHMFGLKPRAWYMEHRSRVAHDVSYGHQLEFDHARLSQWLYDRARTKSSTFVDHTAYVPLDTSAEQACKLIAFYLPQFHTIPENDEWHGKGFTEWTNVTKALPQFVGHHQPQLPIDVGFYDLAHPRVMHRQIELARNYGVHGFCFHFYWFSGGQQLLETPLRNWLADPTLDLPFCINWANENWSKLWDGGDRQVLLKQHSQIEDAEPFFDAVALVLADRRYIHIDGKPLLLIYRPGLFKQADFVEFTARLRAEALRRGHQGLFLAMAHNDYFEDDPRDWGLDGAVEFPPQRIVPHRRYLQDGNPVNPHFKGYVYSLDECIRDGSVLSETPAFPLFRGIFPGWDNTARKAYSNASVYQLSPAMYQQWLQQILRWTRGTHAPGQRLVFVNAWNEWAEGAHLEPDNHFGYAFLHATRAALAAAPSDYLQG